MNDTDQQPFAVTVPVTFDADGLGVAQAGPSSPGEIWYPDAVAVAGEDTAPGRDAQCRVYLVGPGQVQYVDGTNSGLTGDKTGRVAGRVLGRGRWIWAVWTGGQPGASATLSITGSRVLA